MSLDSSFKCPVCGRLHPLSEGDSFEDGQLHCTDNETSQVKEIKGVEQNAEFYTGVDWAFKQFNTRRTGYFNAPLKNVTPRQKMRTKSMRNW